MFKQLILIIFLLPLQTLLCEEWTSFRGSPNNLGVAPGNLAEKPQLKWKFTTGGDIKGSAVSKNGFVYFASEDEKVYCLKLENGEKVWEKKLDNPIEASPLLLEDSLIIGTVAGTLYKLNAKNGETFWEFKAGDRFAGAATYFMKEDQPVIVAGSYDNSVYAINFKTGEKIWNFETDNYINGTPAIYKDMIVFGGCDNTLYILDKEGKLAGQVDLGSYIAGTVGVDNGFAYIGHYENEYFKIDLTKKEITWRFKRSNFPFFSSPAIDEKLVLFGGRDKRVYAVDKETGKKVWDFQTRGKVDSSPIICGDKTVFASTDGRIYLLEKNTGKLLWNYEIGKPVIASPSVINGFILIGSSDFTLYCFK